jgi:hypothetical protein
MPNVTILPTLPSETNAAITTAAWEFPPLPLIDESSVAIVVHRWKQKPWLEQCFFGEDFAGREDCTLTKSRPCDWQGRRELGPFFSRPNDVPHSMGFHRPTIRPSEVERILSAKRFRRRSIAAASTVAAILAASFLVMLQPAHSAAESIQAPAVKLTILKNSSEFPAVELEDEPKLMEFSLRAPY